MDYRNEDSIKKSDVFLENGKKAVITGVLEVISFNEEVISLNTVLKRLEILGDNLKICKLDLKNGEISISGDIYGCRYTDFTKNKKDKQGIFKNFLGKK